MENVVASNQISDIRIDSRKKISISGVKRLISFNPEEFLVETTLGVVLLKGNELEVMKLDTVEGILNIKGFLNSFDYMDRTKKSESLLTRLFK